MATAASSYSGYSPFWVITDWATDSADTILLCQLGPESETVELLATQLLSDDVYVPMSRPEWAGLDDGLWVQETLVVWLLGKSDRTVRYSPVV